MTFGVVVFPGSNCDQDIIRALRHDLGQPVRELWHKDTSVGDADVVVLPGGFSYGDYLRSGAIARFSPIMESVVQHARRGGYVLGICNGFQILAEAGLVPGALLQNREPKFTCQNVYLKAVSRTASISAGLDPDLILQIPIAHAEGRYYAPANDLKKLEDNDQVLFRYCDEQGNITNEANPNGSLNNIAGVCNEGRNVMGLMPHPERACRQEIGNTDGYTLLSAMVESMMAVS